MSMTAPFRPREVTDIELAFPAHVEALMPAQHVIPDEFKRDSNPWVKVQSRWFFSGLAGVTFTPKDGIDPAAAFRHLRAVQGSFEPKHEHKMSAVAFLMAQWFEDVAIDGKSLVTA